jgi:GDPmannose 4,6-dehydratase
MKTNNFMETYYGKKIDTANILNIEDAAILAKGKKVCVITGVTGQDGSHMIDYLLENTNLFIVGGVRRLSVYNHKNIKHIKNNRFILLNFDLTDAHSISRTVEKLQPDYFINFAAQSFVASSWDFARQTWATNSTAVLDILEAIRLYRPSCRLYQAGSSEEFGNVIYAPQDEKHP